MEKTVTWSNRVTKYQRIKEKESTYTRESSRDENDKILIEE